MDTKLDTLNYFVQKFKIDLTKESPIMVPIGRFKDIPKLFAELGFKEGAEIGVYEGAYSRNLLKRIPGLHLIGVDLWEAYPGFKDFEANDLEDAKFRALKNVEGYNCQMIQGWSDKVADAIPDDSLDFIFIDGNHAYEWCVWDMYKWIPKVRSGGIVFGHDFDDYTNHRRRWKEMNVINAVTGYMASYKIKPWFVTTNNSNKCWLYVKP